MRFVLLFVGSGIVVVLISTTIRLFATFLAVFRTSLNMKERMFIAFAWIPKAYVQVCRTNATIFLYLACIFLSLRVKIGVNVGRRMD